MGVSHFSAVSSTLSVLAKDATADVTLTTQEAQDVGILDVTAVGAGGKSVTFPSAIEGKMLTVRNEDAADAVTVLVSGQTGIAVAATKTAILKCNATDFERVTADA